MRYLFDSSAIFTAVKENKVEVLAGNHTLDLARYELGNIIWKDFVLHTTVTEQEARGLIRVIRHTLSLMDVLSVAGSEEEILENCRTIENDFLRCSLCLLCQSEGMKLVTEDLRLIKRQAQC